MTRPHRTASIKNFPSLAVVADHQKELMPGSPKGGIVVLDTNRIYMRTLAFWWCRKFHRLGWPIHGHQICLTCGKSHKISM